MKVSIITVSLNSSKTILETINSVNNQTYHDIEHLFIDGDSSDNTIDTIRTYSKRSNVIISEKDSGIYNAINKGLRHAKGEIVGFLNADDTLDNQTIISQIVANFNSDVDCIYGNIVFVNQQNKVVRKWSSKEFKAGLFQYSWTPAHPTFYCRNSIYKRYGGYREDFLIASDVDLMFRFLEIHKIKSLFINQNLVRMKIGGVSTKSLSSTILITKEVFITFKENDFNYSVVVYVISKIFKALKQLI